MQTKEMLQEASTSPVEDFHREWDRFFQLVSRTNEELSSMDDKKVDQRLKDISYLTDILEVYWAIEKRSYQK